MDCFGQGVSREVSSYDYFLRGMRKAAIRALLEAAALPHPHHRRAEVVSVRASGLCFVFMGIDTLVRSLSRMHAAAVGAQITACASQSSF